MIILDSLTTRYVRIFSMLEKTFACATVAYNDISMCKICKQRNLLLSDIFLLATIACGLHMFSSNICWQMTFFSTRNLLPSISCMITRDVESFVFFSRGKYSFMISKISLSQRAIFSLTKLHKRLK